MAERKALTHYYPPDFDPAKIPRRKQAADRQQAVRLMAPFSMRCLSCREYIYKGKKFNARKEQVLNEDYLGIKIFRFYIKCTQCSAEITFKTDPKNTDYVAEHGASRNFEPWRGGDEGENADDGDEEGLTEEQKLEKRRATAAENADPMKAIEDKTLDSRREMEILDALQDIRTRNARLERVDTDAVLAARHSTAAQETEDFAANQEDEALVRKYFGKALDVDPSSPAATSEIKVKRKVLAQDNEDEEPDIHSLLTTPIAPAPSQPLPKKKKKANAPNAFGLVKRKPAA